MQGHKLHNVIHRAFLAYLQGPHKCSVAQSGPHQFACGIKNELRDVLTLVGVVWPCSHALSPFLVCESEKS